METQGPAFGHREREQMDEKLGDEGEEAET